MAQKLVVYLSFLPKQQQENVASEAAGLSGISTTLFYLATAVRILGFDRGVVRR